MSDERLIQIRKLHQWHAFHTIQMHEAVARMAGLSGTDHKYLAFIIEKGQMTAGELAALSGLTTGAVTGLIDRFEKKGLVKRAFAPEDRRKVFIVPDAEKINALLAPLYAPYRTEIDTLIGSFSEDELKIIETYMTKSTAILSHIRNQLLNR